MPAEDGTDLEAELIADSKNASGCSVCMWLDSRDDAALWDKAFANPAITKAAITRGMRKRGFTGKASPISSHRDGRHRVG